MMNYIESVMYERHTKIMDLDLIRR